MRTKIWWLSNVIWLILFLSGIVLITMRRVDGAGVIQTPQTKLIALVVLGVFGLFILLAQLLIYWLVCRKRA
ncbi:DUF3923 family protein [Loigolactobacillus coryniformis]|uniref:DUF3923 family protein n=1 Tax=Loigolactobacillus coryniformis TaxID=1610 RepID=UPI002341AD95|nr:DUF3923 family protein [Loigolactobacillus coryniformis]MDC4186993.1 DUF3923 family protein [Loigolactobacillus coryniformis]